MHALTGQPIPYGPDLERSSGTAAPPPGRIRPADSVALLTGRMKILHDLDAPFAQGLFAWPDTYCAVVRISAEPGMAIKLVDVEGPRLSEADGAETQDFVLSATAPNGNPLRQTYISQPLLFGLFMARLSVVPVSAGLIGLPDASQDVAAWRRTMLDYFARQGAEWEVRAQLCTNLKTTPIDGSRIWSEASSSSQPVARLMIEPQVAWSDERSAVIDDGMAFSSWTGLAAHRPLGDAARTQQARDEAARRVREDKRGRRIIEPHSFDYLFADEPARAEVFYP